MSELSEPTLDPQVARVAPTLKLSRRGLVCCLCAVIGVGLAVYAIFPESVGGPPLPVETVLDRAAVETVGGQGAVVTEIVRVSNQTDHEIKKLTIEINGQYYLFRDSPLLPRENLVVPLRVFTDKRSSQRFDPARHQVDEIIVAGQLPNGARGISKFEFTEH